MSGADLLKKQATMVKEGWLSKRGEYIQSWRPRYFVLKSDGSLRGYKGIPKAGDAPINFFDVVNSNLSLDDKSSKPGFTIRFMQITRVVDRTFQCENQEECESWVAAYATVKAKLEGGLEVIDASERMRAMSFVDPKNPKPCDMGLEDFDMLKVLGKGTFGKVMLAKQKATEEIFAIKILKKSMVLEKDELAHTLTENSVLAKCTHPFLTSLKYSFQTPDLLCFVMEYVNGGEIFFHLSKERRFSEDRVRFYVAEISSAITYLHGQGIIYRDLKLENLMLDRHGHIKITDFGLCKEEITFGATTTTFCGTPEYLAPEVIEDSDYGRAVDWWGVGVVLYEMICGCLPFRSRDHEELFGLILTQEVRFPSFMSADAQDCAGKLLIKDPSLRLGGGERDGQEVKEHPFFASIDWTKLDQRAIVPPFVPKVASETDVSNFDPYFTNEKPAISPEESDIGEDKKEKEFADFASVAK